MPVARHDVEPERAQQAVDLPGPDLVVDEHHLRRAAQDHR